MGGVSFLGLGGLSAPSLSLLSPSFPSAAAAAAAAAATTTTTT